MINEPKEMNSGTPQGIFLKRAMVVKQDGSGQPLLPTDFIIGHDVSIYGKCIRVTDIDTYTREWFEVRYTFLNLFQIIECWSTPAWAYHYPLWRFLGLDYQTQAPQTT